jgi:hypothetical protein
MRGKLPPVEQLFQMREASEPAPDQGSERQEKISEVAKSIHF